jgi:peptidyl-dipeptidase A
VTRRHALLALAIGASLVATSLSFTGCKRTPSPGSEPAPAPGTVATTAPEGETADQFVARVNAEYKAMYPELTAAQWLSSTYINDDSQLLSSKANERFLAQLKSWI